jgi:F0F1-type ATP synthase delta subunit
LIVDNNQENVAAVSPTVVTADTNGSINEEHCQVDKICHQFKTHISAETNSLDKWSEFVQTYNAIYHHDPDINKILKNSLVSTAQYNQFKTTILTGFFKAAANNQSLAQ